MFEHLKMAVFLRRRWKRTQKRLNKFEITEDSVEAVVTRGEEKKYRDGDPPRVRKVYTERTYELYLDSMETKALYETARAYLRPGASEGSIRDMMQDMAIRALDGKPLVPRQSNAFYYVFLAVSAAIAVGLLVTAWNVETAWIRPIKQTVLMTFGNADVRVERLNKNWNLEDAVKVYGGMPTEEALQRMLNTLQSVSGVPSVKYRENGTISTEWAYEIPASSLKRTMRVAVALKEKDFFTQEQYETLAAVFLRRYPDAEYAFDDDGMQVFLEVLKGCSNDFLSAVYDAASERARLPMDVQVYLKRRLPAQ